jgi:hypothetical protein
MIRKKIEKPRSRNNVHSTFDEKLQRFEALA